LDGVHLKGPKAGHAYLNAQNLVAPKGNWAVSLPSDDNKLRRKWYHVRDSHRVAAGNLELPEHRGELVAEGQGTTLRWRPKYQYAHGFAGQDGAHWLGGYSDIRDPAKVGADSSSGKGLPRVNVYDWSMDKSIHDDPVSKKSLEHPQFSLWQDMEKLGDDVSLLIWPPLIPAHKSRLHSQGVNIDKVRGPNALPSPLGEIMADPQPVSLLQRHAPQERAGAMSGLEDWVEDNLLVSVTVIRN